VPAYWIRDLVARRTIQPKRRSGD